MSMSLTRRQFTALLGVVATGGIGRLVEAAAPAELSAKPEDIWAELIEGNRRFVAGTPRLRPLVPIRQELAGGQHPKVVILGCSDSRVSPTLIFDETLGDLFVIRTAGNVADAIALGSIEYAVEHLHVQVLVVLGHEKCGAVTAVVSGMPTPTRNLEAIVRKIAPAVRQLRGTATGDRLVHLAVEANVRQSAKDIVANSPIVRRAIGAGTFTIIQAVYQLQTGEVIRLV